MNDISQYVNLCGFQGLSRKNNSWNFRCQVCGDSKKSKKKKRGWIIWNKKNSTWIYYCHNCGISISFMNFLKQYHYDSFKEYIKYEFKNKYNKTKTINETIENKELNYINFNIPKISELKKNHPAYIYIKKRKIPRQFYSYIGYHENFKEWINTKIPNKFKRCDKLDKRIIIPFYNRDKKCFGVAGRSIEDGFPKYITIKFNEDELKIFGMDRVNTQIPVLIFEGQFDSLFFPNSIALGGSDISLEILTKLIPKKNIIFVYDNEINFEIFKKIENVIKEGFRICLLPKDLRKYGKDINDYIKKGMTIKEIFNIIKLNIYSGLIAKLAFIKWKRR